MTHSTFPADCASRFEPIQKLGEGAFDAVWLANQRGLDRRVAVKLLAVDLEDQNDAVSRFLSEARITASLAHPNIVTIIDHGWSGETPWIAYELLPGSTPRERIGRGALPSAEAVDVTLQITSALRAAHQVSVVHRDVKPENVMESRPGHWKLVDFGIAKWTRVGAVKTRTGVILGTPTYLAPEVIAGHSPALASGTVVSLVEDLAASTLHWQRSLRVNALRAWPDRPKSADSSKLLEAYRETLAWAIASETLKGGLSASFRRPQILCNELSRLQALKPR